MHRILIILALFIVFDANAQFTIGPKANVGASWFGIKETKNSSGYNWVDGGSGLYYQAGVATNIGLSKALSIQAEILYTQMSGSYTVESTYTKTDASGNVTGTGYDYMFYSKININQVHLPVQIKVKSNRLYAMTGVSYGISFTNDRTYKRNGSDLITKRRFDKDDFAIVNSTGIFVSKKASIDLKVYTGLMPIDDKGYKLRGFALGSTFLF